MTKEMNMTIENKLVIEKRDLNIYHHSTSSGYLLSYNKRSKPPLALGSVETGDYLHISIVSGPGDLKNECWINLPSWVDFEFSAEGKMVLTHSGEANRIILKIPPGPPTWQLKVTRSDDFQFLPPSDHVIIGDALSRVQG